MQSDRNIGRVLNVDSFRVVIEIDKDNKSLTKSHYSGICPIARINSYIIIPVGFEKIVGHITKVQMFSEETEIKNKSTITLPNVKRLVWATMIGTIRKESSQEYYEQGIKSFPCLDNPVYFILKEELDCIFDKNITFCKDDCINKSQKKYYVSIGECIAFPEYKIKIDPDAIFSKHLAVLGNTGSGKSCTISSLIQTLLKTDFDGKKIDNAHFVIFDTNGEYSSAFIKKEDKIGNCLLIDKEGLKIPYWFMNFEDFKYLFSPSEKTQEPILSTALNIAKQKKGNIDDPDITLKCLLIELETIHEQLNSTDKPNTIKKVVYNLCCNIIDYIDMNKQYIVSKIEFVDELKNKIEELKASCPEITDKYSVSGIPTQNKKDFLSWYESKIIYLDKIISFDAKMSIDVDKPIYFTHEDLMSSLKTSTKILGESNKNIKINEYLATLKLRINRYFSDERYDFIFNNYNSFPNALATFFRYCLGRMGKINIKNIEEEAEKNENGTPPFLEYYQSVVKMLYQKGENHQVIIFDLSLLPSDILGSITAFLSRLMLEFLQRLGKDKKKRGSFPVVLVLEEAHNYIPEKKSFNEKETISKVIFERIAREGRKYGLSLVVSSQRPSELSKTVLSQCNSFIVHRIQNPEDQKYIQTIVPSINEDLLKQLPSLAQRTALIFGDCVRAPAQLYMNEANPMPDSKDPKFMSHWLKLDDVSGFEPEFEKICDEWEGQKEQQEKVEKNIKKEKNK